MLSCVFKRPRTQLAISEPGPYGHTAWLGGRTTTALEKVECPRAKRVGWATRNACRIGTKPRLNFGGWDPVRPFSHAAVLGNAGLSTGVDRNNVATKWFRRRRLRTVSPRSGPFPLLQARAVAEAAGLLLQPGQPRTNHQKGKPGLPRGRQPGFIVAHLSSGQSGNGKISELTITRA